MRKIIISIGIIFIGILVGVVIHLYIGFLSNDKKADKIYMPIDKNRIILNFEKIKQMVDDRNDISVKIIKGISCIINHSNYTYTSKELLELFTPNIVDSFEGERRYYMEQGSVMDIYNGINVYNLQKLNDKIYTIDYKDYQGYIYRYTLNLDNNGKICKYYFDNVIS